MVTTELDITRYLELLAKEENLQNEGKSIQTENPEDARELLNYQVILSTNIAFSERKNYSALIENYLEEKSDMTMIDFDHSFYKMWCEIRDRWRPMEEELKKNSTPTISVDSRAKRYSPLIHSIVALNDTLTNDGFYDIPEEEHRNEIKQIFGEMKELLQEE